MSPEIGEIVHEAALLADHASADIFPPITVAGVAVSDVMAGLGTVGVGVGVGVEIGSTTVTPVVLVTVVPDGETQVNR
jgi:hypothetical protein